MTCINLFLLCSSSHLLVIGIDNSEKESCFKKIQDTQSKTDTIGSIKIDVVTNLCISANELVNERWDLLTDTEKKATDDNMQYVYQIICPGTYLHKNMETFYEKAFHCKSKGILHYAG